MELGKWYFYDKDSFIPIKKVKRKFLGFTVGSRIGEPKSAEFSSSIIESDEEITNKKETSMLNKLTVKYLFEHKKAWTPEEFFSGKFF